MEVTVVLLGLAGFLVGSFPTGVVLSRRRFGIDVREMGSGNIGATNVARNFGWYAGILVFLVDFLKGLVPLILIRWYWPDQPWLLTVVGLSLVLGHCFSIFLKGRGGKGVATSLACLVVVSPTGAAIAGGLYAALLMATKISAVGSLGGLLFALGYVSFTETPLPYRVLVYAVAVIVIIRHHSNIRRLIHG